MLSRSVPKLDFLDVQEKVPEPKDKWYKKMLTKVALKPLSYPNWRADGSRLWKYSKCAYSQSRPEGDNWKEVVPREERRDVIVEAHE